MKLIPAAFLIAATFLQAHAVPTADTNKNTADNACGYPEVPLYTAYNPTIVDHAYNTNGDIIDYAVTHWGYVNGPSVAAYVYNTSESNVPSAVPLYALYSSAGSDNYITASWSEVQWAEEVGGYTYNGLIGYVYEEALCGSVPLYRLFNAQGVDHYFTTDENERYAMMGQGYADEGVAAYVFTDTP